MTGGVAGGRNPEWPENLVRNAESRVGGGSGIWTIFKAESGFHSFFLFFYIKNLGEKSKGSVFDHYTLH